MNVLRLVLLSVVLVGCSSSGLKRPKGVPASYQPVDVPAALDATRADLEGGNAERALGRMRVVMQTRGMPNDVRVEAQALLEQAATTRIAEVDDPDELEDLLEAGLPRRLSIRAGIRAARILADEGERVDTFKLIRKIDSLYPQHHERVEAGQLLSRVGLSLAADDGKYGFFFHYRSLAPQVLEYFVLNYPSDPNGPLAYWTLAELYESQRRWEIAIEKHEDLVLWYANSEYVPASKARIPNLQLQALASPEYNRADLISARRTLEDWLQDYPGHPLEEQVTQDLEDCLRRLSDNDLIVARFYRRVDNLVGAEYHARRALEEARGGKDSDQVEEAEELLGDIVERVGGS